MDPNLSYKLHEGAVMLPKEI